MDKKVLENLMAAFAGESQANRKYLAYAQKAEEEGYENIAKLFKSAAAAETIHAHGHFKAAGKLHDTLENLKDAVSGETYEFQEMYPPFLENAKEAKEMEAVKNFMYAMKAEKVHAELYQEALDSIREGKDVEGEFYLCPVCGNIEKKIPEKCPICAVDGKLFTQV